MKQLKDLAFKSRGNPYATAEEAILRLVIERLTNKLNELKRV